MSGQVSEGAVCKSWCHRCPAAAAASVPLPMGVCITRSNYMWLPLPMQDLAVRLVALGAVAVVANVPLGMWRAHLKKLSPAW